MTEIIAKGPRMLMSFDGSFVRVQNADGSVTVRDTRKGAGYRMKNGQVLSIEEPCRHTNTQPYQTLPSGEVLIICLDCGEVF
jgi:methionine aminopeptidase